MDTDALDVWLAFDDDNDEEASHEANTYLEADTGLYRVDWCHTFVGQISSRHFATHAEARAWLEAAGYRDFSS